MLNLNNYIPNEKIVTENFVIRKLEASDVERDYKTFINNVEAVKRQRGGTWPDGTETLEEDRIDLSWHQREFELGTSFAYQVLSPDEQEMYGCVYFYPPKHPNNGAAQYEPEGIDVSVNFWTTEEAYQAGIYDKLYKFVEEWLEEWPFRSPVITNLIKPSTND
jgi:hypothetical protein